MKKTILALSLLLACAAVALAQKNETRATGDATSQTSAAASSGDKSISLDSGTRIAGELQNTIDVRKAKVGDEVVLKTTKAIKSQGRTVVGKGARLVGHVTEVAQKSKDSNASRIGILFDRLEQGTLELPITATISSITSSRANANAGNDDLFGSSVSSSGSSSTAASSSNGGLLGGVVNNTTSTAGNVVGNTTSAVGSTVNSTTNAVGNTASGVGRSLGRIQISESSSSSVDGSSTLSLQGGNLRLDKGTNFNLVVTQSAGAGIQKDQ